MRSLTYLPIGAEEESAAECNRFAAGSKRCSMTLALRSSPKRSSGQACRDVDRFRAVGEALRYAVFGCAEGQLIDSSCEQPSD